MTPADINQAFATAGIRPPPALGTVRKWLRDGEAAGVCERRRGESAGKPGRPPDLWQLTEKGRQLKRRQRAERMPES